MSTSDSAQKCRQVCMWTILGTRTTMSGLVILLEALAFHMADVIIDSVFAVLGFLFVGYCLAVIGEARGRRKVFGKVFVS